ncbi:MAG: type VII toxin-antitoxin system MntA family adenylyltransferase antitoxin [Geminicoccaceae bacterium]
MLTGWTVELRELVELVATNPDLGRAACYRSDATAASVSWRNAAVNAMSAQLADDFPRRALIEDLAGRLARHPAVERVWLFGSRARGDNFERSDVDLAIEAPAMAPDDWLRIKLDFEDEAPTLLLIDLVRFEDAPEILREQILDEGIVVYERTRAQTAVR